MYDPEDFNTYDEDYNAWEENQVFLDNEGDDFDLGQEDSMYEMTVDDWY